MTRFKNPQILFLALAIVVLSASVMAEVPQLINYQGRLTDSDGDPVPNAPYSIVFTIYDHTSTAIWQETHASVTTSDGLFNVLLGAGDHSGYGDLDESIFSDSVRWLGIKVGEDPEIQPRTQFVSVPYAYHALISDTASYATAGGGDHAATHQNGGADELNVAGLSGVLADPQTPATHADSHSDGSSDPISHGNLAGIGETDHHSNANDPTASEKAALAGEGTPSGTNKYTTKSYVDGELAGKADAADVTPLEKVIKDVAVVDNAGTYEIPADYYVEDTGSLKIEHLPNLVAKLGGTTQALVTANVMRLTIEVEAYAENTMATFNGPCWTAPGTLGETTGKAHWAVEFKNADGSSYSGVDWKLLKVTTYLK